MVRKIAMGITIIATLVCLSIGTAVATSGAGQSTQDGRTLKTGFWAYNCNVSSYDSFRYSCSSWSTGQYTKKYYGKYCVVSARTGNEFVYTTRYC